MGSFKSLVSGLNDVLRDNKITRTALTSVLPVHKKRIFQDGMDASGSRIGTYSTKKISIAKKNQSRDTGHTVFQNGYNQYKTEIGKNNGYVNLRNTDQMMSDYGLKVSNNNISFGFSNLENAKKSGWMEDKYEKDIFFLTDNENKTFVDLQAALLKTSLEKYL